MSESNIITKNSFSALQTPEAEDNSKSVLDSQEVQGAFKRLSEKDNDNSDIAIILRALTENQKILAENQQDIRELLSNQVKQEKIIEVHEGRISRLETDLMFLKERFAELQARQMSHNLIITNLPDEPHQDLEAAVRRFWADKLFLASSNVEIDVCHRTGPERSKGPRDVLVALVKRSDKNRIMDAAKNLPSESKHRIFSQQPQDYRASQSLLLTKRKELKKSSPPGTKIKVKGHQLLVNGTVKMDMQEMRHWGARLDHKTTTTEAALALPNHQSTPPKDFDGSSFVAHIMPIKRGADVWPALAALNRQPGVARATHNIFAARIGESVMLEDDREWGAADEIYKVMKEKNLRDCIVVITRWYGGSHIGKRRFEIMRELTESLLDFI